MEKRQWCKYTCWIFIICFVSFIHCEQPENYKLVPYEDLLPTLDIFTQSDVSSFGQLLFDITRYQLIVGARDHLFRLSLEGLKKLEEAYWPPSEDNVATCRVKGKTEDDCKNYIKVLLSHNGKIFSCGTNAFKPECTWRDITSLKTVIEEIDGIAKSPHRPDANTSSIITLEGDYYVGSSFEFSGHDYAIYRTMGNKTFLRSRRFDHNWLNNPSFITAYEIEDFVFFFFRETAAEYRNCGKAVYSRVGRICKNDQGGKYLLKDSWTTFLKARLNCSIPGSFPFYFNEIQGVHYVERDQMLYATFTTPENSIYGTAICGYNISAIHKAFSGPFKYQSNIKSAWEPKAVSNKLFQCETPVDDKQFLDSEMYQLVDNAVQPFASHPLFSAQLERLSHIVVDLVPTKDNVYGVHVIFAATVEGNIKKMVVLKNEGTTCLIEELQIFPEGTSGTIMALKLLKDTASLYIGTENSVIRVPVQRCHKFKTKEDCIDARDPYCGWNNYEMACTTTPHRNPLSDAWIQKETGCPKKERMIDGGWGGWIPWFECAQSGRETSGEMCMCQQRFCNSPSPKNGGEECQGMSLQVTNCTRNGQWTEWSSWSPCSQTCGLATKTRRRTCGNPAPAFGGRYCIGATRDEIYCTSNPPCPLATPHPIDGQWSEWSTWDECSTLCDGGMQTRRRLCNSPPPQHGGRECPGCNTHHQICNTHQCPEVKKSTSWTPFLRVNRTRDGYFEQRFRFSCRANVRDESQLRMGHMKKEERFCVDGGSPNCLDTDDDEWEQWSVWSHCDDSGEQHRRRKCKLIQSSPAYCSGPTKETRMCILQQSAHLPSTARPEDGIHAAHVAGGFICGVIIGALLSACAIYFYMKRKNKGERPVATQLIPVKPNTYLDENEWKNNYSISKDSQQKAPLREATIKRNGNFRAQIQSDQMF